jgi:23S rRNA G2069 N7-methylase RlmK/C1962 C5-methylase RlmI
LQLSWRPIPEAGALLRVQDAKGDHLGWALSDGPGAVPAFRVLSRERHPVVDAAFWAARVEAALALRRAKSGAIGAGACRLVNADADQVPGLCCDLWAPGLATLELSSRGMQAYLPMVEGALYEQARLKSLWRRTPAEDGLSPWHRSPLTPQAPAKMRYAEGEQAFTADFEDEGTGPLPMEQRSWRRWVREGAPGGPVLLLGAGHALASSALAGGASAVEAPGGDPFKALEKLKAKEARFGVAAAVMPLSAKLAWGRFEASKHLPALAEALRGVAAPGGRLLLGLSGIPAHALYGAGPAPGWSPLAPGADLAGMPLAPAWVARFDPAPQGE